MTSAEDDVTAASITIMRAAAVSLRKQADAVDDMVKNLAAAPPEMSSEDREKLFTMTMTIVVGALEVFKGTLVKQLVLDVEEKARKEFAKRGPS